MKVICPNCHEELPPESVHVKLNQGYCPECGELFSLSSMLSDNEDHEDDSKRLREKPPRRISIQRSNFEAVLAVRPSRLPCFFLIPFTAIWSGFSLGSIYGTQIANGEFDLTQSLFGIPFFLGTVALLTSIVTMLFTRTVFIVNERGVSMKKYRFRTPEPESKYSEMLMNRKTSPAAGQDAQNGFFSKYWPWPKVKGIALSAPTVNRMPRLFQDNSDTMITLPATLPYNYSDYISAFLREEARKFGRTLS